MIGGINFPPLTAAIGIEREALPGKPSSLVNSASICAADAPHIVVQNLDDAFESNSVMSVNGVAP